MSAVTEGRSLKVGVVIITMGTRPDELRALIGSVAKQEGDAVEVVVVGNGSPVPDLTGLAIPVRTVELPENLGIPGGRNVGIAAFRRGASVTVADAADLAAPPHPGAAAPERPVQPAHARPVDAAAAHQEDTAHAHPAHAAPAHPAGTPQPPSTAAAQPSSADTAPATTPATPADPTRTPAACTASQEIGEGAGSGPFDVDVLLFLDDDGLLAQQDTAQLCRAAFATDPKLGIISFRIADPATGASQRRHVPRLRASDPLRSSRVTTFLGGASAVRTSVIAEVGGLPGDFFYAHEETDLAWRALNAGWLIDYRSDMVLLHPATAPSRHAVYHRMVARNRVWLARRNLPAPLVPVYLGVWLLVTMARRPSRPALHAWFGGFMEGWMTPCGPRRPMKWRTVWRLTRLGRPPVI